MSQTERVFRIHRLLDARRAPSLEKLMSDLEVSRATIKRDIEYMRDRLDAPIIYGAGLRGYRYQCQPDQPPYQLPGLWFTAEEMHALLIMQDLLGQLESKVLGEALRPLQRKIESLLETGKLKKKELQKRFRIIGARHRPVENRHFQVASTATLQRKRLEIDYFSRSRGEAQRRIVSPQRLIWYSSNWYLDAWCHLRDGARSFSLDAVQSARILPEAALEVDPGELDARLGAGYGIFAGPAVHTAVLRFRPPAAHWVEREVWHRRQRLMRLAGGEIQVEVPYSDPRELVLDVLRYGSDVVVESPATLRSLVVDQLHAAAERYRAARRAPQRAQQPGA